MSRRPYVREETWRWVLRHPRYLRYMARELSCLFVGAWTLLLVWGLKCLSEGPAAWNGFLDALRTPLSLVFHIVGLAFVAYHSITWFNLTPKALPLELAGSRLPDGAISGVHFAAWGAVSLAILWLAGAF